MKEIDIILKNKQTVDIDLVIKNLPTSHTLSLFSEIVLESAENVGVSVLKSLPKIIHETELLHLEANASATKCISIEHGMTFTSSIRSSKEVDILPEGNDLTFESEVIGLDISRHLSSGAEVNRMVFSSDVLDVSGIRYRKLSETDNLILHELDSMSVSDIDHIEL